MQRLRIHTGDRVAVLNAPESATGLTMEIPHDVAVSHELRGTFQQTHYFVRTRAELIALVPQVLPARDASGLFWIYFPKKRSTLQTDLSRDAGWGQLTKAGLRRVSLIGLDDTWSAFAVRRRELSPSRTARRRSPERADDIDRRNRKVMLPYDVRKAFGTATIAGRTFRALCFTHQKEYIEWILDARQAEMRTRRIQKLVSQLTKGPP